MQYNEVISEVTQTVTASPELHSAIAILLQHLKTPLGLDISHGFSIITRS
jgi:hypothetical protein